MLRKIIGNILFISIASISLAQTDYHRFSKIPISYNWTASDYFGGIQNWEIKQGQEGMIYVANNYGLLEFDGEEWKIYQITGNTRSTSLYIDPSNRIYIGGQNQIGYFERDEAGLLVYNSLLEKIPEKYREVDNVWDITALNDKIYFNNIEYLYEYDGLEVNVYPFDSKAGFMFQSGSRLFFFIPKKGLVEFQNGSFKFIEGSEAVKENSVVDILPYQKNSFLVFQANGNIFKYTKEEFVEWKSEVSELLKKSQINVAKRLENNTVAIGTQNAGLLVLNLQGELIFQLSKGKGLNGNTIYSLSEDNFKNLWIGLNNGISCIELSSPFSLIDESLGVPGTGYAAALANNKLYLGTNNGLFFQPSKPAGKSVSDKAYEIVQNSEGQVYSVEELDNKLWMGHHTGAFYVEDDYANRLYDRTGVWKFDQIPDTKKLIAGTYQGFIEIDTENNVKELEGFNESSRLFEFSDDSIIWMAHGYKGVYRLNYRSKFTEWDFYGAKKGFPSNLLINIFRINNQLLFPAEYGLYSYEPTYDLFTPYEPLETYFGKYNHISAMNADSQGNIFYILDRQFGVLQKNKYQAYTDERVKFRKIDKYLSDDLENIHVIDHENILIGAKEGFVHYNPTKETLLNEKFATYIRKVSITTEEDSLLIFGKPDSSFNYEFQPEIKSFIFEYASPYFDGFEDIEYQYRLKGFEEKWTDWTSVTMKEYTNLPYDDYVFEVRARNIYGEISSSARFQFELIAPWYLSNTAFFLYVLGVFIIFGLSLFLLDTKHRFDKEKLVKNQEQEIEKKESQLFEIEQKSEERITQLKNEKLKAEIDHKNRELTSTTMHLLNKNEFMLTVKNKLETLSKNGSSKSDELKRIIKTINRNIEEDNDWDHFTKHFDEVHGGFLRKLKESYPDLTPQETKLSAYLRMNLSSKEIAQLLNISVRGVEVSRYRLRKKLDLDRNTNLVTFMMNL